MGGDDGLFAVEFDPVSIVAGIPATCHPHDSVPHGFRHRCPRPVLAEFRNCLMLHEDKRTPYEPVGAAGIVKKAVEGDGRREAQNAHDWPGQPVSGAFDGLLDGRDFAINARPAFIVRFFFISMDSLPISSFCASRLASPVKGRTLSLLP